MARKMKPSDRFFFGKHKGSTLEEVRMRDPGWIQWALRESVIEIVEEKEEKKELDLIAQMERETAECLGVRECPF